MGQNLKFRTLHFNRKNPRRTDKKDLPESFRTVKFWFEMSDFSLNDKNPKVLGSAREKFGFWTNPFNYCSI